MRGVWLAHLHTHVMSLSVLFTTLSISKRRNEKISAGNLPQTGAPVKNLIANMYQEIASVTHQERAAAKNSAALGDECRG